MNRFRVGPTRSLLDTVTRSIGAALAEKRVLSKEARLKKIQRLADVQRFRQRLGLIEGKRQ